MNVHRAYQQPSTVGPTRIDKLLALFDATLRRLRMALEALQKGDQGAAKESLVRAQVLIAGLAAGVDVERGELAVNFLRLYHFALCSVRKETIDGVQAALRVLLILNEGLVEIHPEAQQLELSGQIPSAEQTLGLRATG